MEKGKHPQWGYWWITGIIKRFDRAYEGNEVKWEMPEKVYPNPKSLEINELEGLDSEPIYNQSVTY